MEFKGKVVIITGSSSGIGEGTAMKFASLGANVVITGRDELKIKNVAQKCRQISGEKVLEVKADLLKDNEVKNLFEKTIKEFGKIDILVNNAGVGSMNSIKDPNIMESFDTVMNTNVRCVLLLTSLVVPYLEKTKGSIINISSCAGLIPRAQMMIYCTAKSALDMFSKCLALELGPKGIRVNSINPAAIRTPIFNNYSPQALEKVVEYCKNSYPLGRIGEVEDVAELVAFIASERASFITGTTIPVDGGSLNSSAPRVSDLLDKDN
jgi:NAD(P)-dependent dehydrogenase (short-subunit alcohol dehydrogenase family)